jgi:hypothetical protein
MRALQMSALVREMARAGLRQRFPQANEDEIRLREIRQRLGDELFQKVYGPVLPD